MNYRPPWWSQKCDTVVEFQRVHQFGPNKKTKKHSDCKPNSVAGLDGQFSARGRFRRESLFFRSDCRRPQGSQKCDTIVEFTVCMWIASPIQSQVWTVTFKRERDPGANIFSPELKCRSPRGSWKCDTVVEFSVCMQIVIPIELQVWTERDSGAKFCSLE